MRTPWRRKSALISARSRPCVASVPWISRRIEITRFSGSLAIALLRRHERRLGMRVRGVVVDAALDLAPEVADQPLDRPGGGVAERADGVALDLGRDLQEHVDLAPLRSPLGHAGEDAPHPAGALAAGGALAARLVLVEIRDAGDRADDVGRAVEYDHGRGAKSAFEVAQGVEVHRGVDDLFGRHERDRRAARDRAQEVVPAAAHAAAMAVDELAEGDAHLLLDVAGLVDVPGDAEELGAGVVRLAEPREPGAAAAQDGRRDRDGLDVVDGRRAAVEAHIGGERRFQPRQALLALEALEQRRLLAADIGPGAVVDVAVEREAVDVVLADQPRRIVLVDRPLQCLALADVFAANVDVGGVRPHGEAGDEAALDKEMRIVPHDLPVLAGAGLRLVGIDDEVVRAAVRLLRHERPFEPGREAGAAAPAQARLLHLVDDPVAALVEEEPVSVPSPAPARRLEAPRVQAVEVGEDAVAVVQHVAPQPTGSSTISRRRSIRPSRRSCRARIVYTLPISVCTASM